MRTVLVLTAAALALAACNKPAGTDGAPVAPAAAASGGQAASAMAMPVRKPGLWETTMMRDGKPGGPRMAGTGVMKMCVDAASDVKMAAFGGRMGRGMCSEQHASKNPDGSYSFASTCTIGAGATVTSKGVASGDFTSKYVVHSESDVSGGQFAQMNGHHVTEITSVYAGPCPAGMAGGDMQLPNGTIINPQKMFGAGGPGSGAGGGGGSQ